MSHSGDAKTLSRTKRVSSAWQLVQVNLAPTQSSSQSPMYVMRSLNICIRGKLTKLLFLSSSYRMRLKLLPTTTGSWAAATFPWSLSRKASEHR